MIFQKTFSIRISSSLLEFIYLATCECSSCLSCDDTHKRIHNSPLTVTNLVFGNNFHLLFSTAAVDNVTTVWQLHKMRLKFSYTLKCAAIGKLRKIYCSWPQELLLNMNFLPIILQEVSERTRCRGIERETKTLMDDISLGYGDLKDSLTHVSNRLATALITYEEFKSIESYQRHQKHTLVTFMICEYFKFYYFIFLLLKHKFLINLFNFLWKKDSVL